MKEEPSKEGSLRSQAHGAVLQLLNGLGENLKDVLLLIDVPEETVERIFSSEASNGNNIELQKFLSTMVHNNKKEDWIILKSALGVIKEHLIASRLDDIIEGKSESAQVKDVISELLNKLGGSWRFFLRLVSIPEKIVRTISPNEMSDRNGRLYKLVAEKLREEKQTNRKQIENALILLEKNNLAEKYKHMMACVVFDESKEDQQEAENEKKTEADDLSEFINGLCGDWKVFLRLIDVPERTVISITESEKKSRHEKLYNLLAEKLLKIDEKCQKQVENMLKLLGKNNLISVLKKMNPRFIQDSNKDPILELLKGLEEDLQFFLELIDIPEKTVDSIVLNQSRPESAKEFVNIMQPWNEVDFRKMESALILMHRYEMTSKIEAIKACNFKGCNSSNATIEKETLSKQNEGKSYDMDSLTSSDTSIEKKKSSKQNENTSFSLDVIHEISSRVTEWKTFGKVLDIGNPYLKNLELIDNESLTKEQLLKQNKDLMMEAVKCFRERKRKIDENSWKFWKGFLLHFRNGREVIADIETVFPVLSSDLDSTLEETSSKVEKSGNQIEEKSYNIDDSQCITSHEDFYPVVLLKNVLWTALVNMHVRECRALAEREKVTNRSYRYAAYRQFCCFIFNRLGKSVRKVLPACGVSKIREKFPSPDGLYVGFRDSDESELECFWSGDGDCREDVYRSDEE